MKPIPKINIKKKYKTEFNYSNDYQHHLDQLIKRIEKENNPAIFRNNFLAVMQLYFDGIIDMEPNTSPQRKKIWLQQEEILNNLCLSGKKCIRSFYRGEGIEFDDVKEIFLPYASKIIKYGSKKRAKSRHLDSLRNIESIQNFGLMLNELSDPKNFFDSLICIASGGFEPSFLAMDITEKELIPVRYSIVTGYRNDKEVKIPKLTTKEDYIMQKVKGKKVLVIEDWIYSGGSLAKVMKYAAKMQPNKLYGAAVKNDQTTYNQTIIPDLKIKVIKDKEPFLCKYKSSILNFLKKV